MKKRFLRQFLPKVYMTKMRRSQHCYIQFVIQECKILIGKSMRRKMRTPATKHMLLLSLSDQMMIMSHWLQLGNLRLEARQQRKRWTTRDQRPYVFLQCCSLHSVLSMSMWWLDPNFVKRSRKDLATHWRSFWRNYMCLSADPMTWTSQKASKFWTRVLSGRTKTLWRQTRIKRPIPTGESCLMTVQKGSLKSQWYTHLQPSIQTLEGIIATYTGSGQRWSWHGSIVNEDSLHLSRSQRIAKEVHFLHASLLLPFKSPKVWICTQGKWEIWCKEERTHDKIGERLWPSIAITSSQWPVGSDSGKKAELLTL